MDLGSQRQRADQCDAGQTRFPFQLQAGAKTQSSHALHHRQRQPGSLGERQAGRDRVADGQVRPSARSLGLFPGDPGRQVAERGRQLAGGRGHCADRITSALRRLVSSLFSASRWRTAKSNVSFPDRNGRLAPSKPAMPGLAQTFDDSSWPAAAVVAEIGQDPLGTPWPAQPVDLLRKNFQPGEGGAERSNLFDRAGNVSALFERPACRKRCSGSGLDRLSQAGCVPGV